MESVFQGISPDSPMRSSNNMEENRSSIESAQQQLKVQVRYVVTDCQHVAISFSIIISFFLLMLIIRVYPPNHSVYQLFNEVWTDLFNPSSSIPPVLATTDFPDVGTFLNGTAVALVSS
jgi:hypothetical protein